MDGILATDSIREAMDKLNINYATMNPSPGINLRKIYSSCKGFVQQNFPLTQIENYSTIVLLLAEVVPNSNRNGTESSVRRVYRRKVKTTNPNKH
jgi:hypothetical protein